MRKLLLAAAFATALGIAPAGACGLHGTIDNPFTTIYPGSLGVALGTRQAVYNGQLAALPELDGESAQERLDERLDQLRTRLEKSGFVGSFAMLVVDAGHWVRFVTYGRTVQVFVHATPAIHDPVMLTSEAALSALLDGRLSAEAARQAGLVRWSGNAPPALAQALQTALASNT